MLRIEQTLSVSAGDLLPSGWLSGHPEFQGSCLYYDIETTGLSREEAGVYLIGTVLAAKNQLRMIQLFAEAPSDEKELLTAFSSLTGSCSFMAQYNGNAFDQPFLEARCTKYGLPSPFGDRRQLDLYRALMPLKKPLTLTSMKQPVLEAFLGAEPRKYPDGKKAVSLYRAYLSGRSPELAEVLLGHNREDLAGLLSLSSMPAYLNILEKRFSPESAELSGDSVIFSIHLPDPLPRIFSFGKEGWYLTGDKERLRLSVRTKDGKLRRYFSSWKDYDYLPEEDLAVPKELSRFLDRSLKRPARPETCYNWFQVTDAFLQDFRQLGAYLDTALPVFLK